MEIADSCRNNRIVIGHDFNFPSIDWNCHSARGLDWVEFDECIQESFLKQNLDGLTRGGNT